MSQAKKITYSLHPALHMGKSFIENMKEKTGNLLEDWFVHIEAEALGNEKEAAAWLKAEHGLGTNYAKTIAKHAFGRGDEYGDPVQLVDALYSGAKADLRPLSDALVAEALSLGKGVTACPGKTIISLYRHHVFAQVKPSTRTRVDLGLALRDAPAQGRLVDTGGFAKGDRISHRIPVTSPEEIDDEVRAWLERAYELDA